MGMYTEFVAGFNLREDAPEAVVTCLRAMMGDAEAPSQLPQHEFFECDSWDLLFRCSSFYFEPPFSHSKMEFSDINNEWGLSIRASLKNYHGEIGKFVQWIGPYVSGHGRTFIGYSRYEEYDDPELLYVEAEGT